MGPMGPWVLGPKFSTDMPNFRLTCLFFDGLALFFAGLEGFCRVCCLPSHHTLIHKGIHKGGRPKAASFMDECVVAGGAADAAETFKSGEK